REKDYLSVDILKTKVVGTGEKIAGYTLTTLGLIVVPAVLIAGESGYVIAFYYYPSHKLISKTELSGNLAAERSRAKKAELSTGALFSKNSKQIDKLLKKFEKSLYNSLIRIEQQLKS